MFPAGLRSTGRENDTPQYPGVRMAEFRHHILTRFNTGLYKRAAELTVSPQQWMEHRLRLFTTLTLPSIIGQSCQDFTWLVLMEDWLNNCPTLIEDARSPRTVCQWDHSLIPAEVQRCYVKDKPYWLQVVHSQNLRNVVDGDNPNRTVRKDLPARPEHLAQFGIDPGHLPTA